MENQNPITNYIGNFLAEKEILIYNANNNVAIDIYDINKKILQAWHANFNQNQIFYFRLVSKQEDSVVGYLELYGYPGLFLSAQQNLLCISNDKESSLSYIQFSQDGFAQISFKANGWLQLVTEQVQNLKTQKQQSVLKLVQDMNPNFFHWAFLVKDRETFKNERVYIEMMINNKKFRVNTVTGTRFAQIEPVDIYHAQNYEFRAKMNEGNYSFYQGNGDKCLSSTNKAVLFLPFTNKLSEWSVIRNVASNEYFLMSLDSFCFATFQQQNILTLDNPNIKLGFQSFRIFKISDFDNEQGQSQIQKYQSVPFIQSSSQLLSKVAQQNVQDTQNNRQVFIVNDLPQYYNQINQNLDNNKQDYFDPKQAQNSQILRSKQQILSNKQKVLQSDQYPEYQKSKIEQPPLFSQVESNFQKRSQMQQQNQQQQQQYQQFSNGQYQQQQHQWFGNQYEQQKLQFPQSQIQQNIGQSQYQVTSPQTQHRQKYPIFSSLKNMTPNNLQSSNASTSQKPNQLFNYQSNQIFKSQMNPVTPFSSIQQNKRQNMQSEILFSKNPETQQDQNGFNFTPQGNTPQIEQRKTSNIGNGFENRNYQKIQNQVVTPSYGEGIKFQNYLFPSNAKNSSIMNQPQSSINEYNPNFVSQIFPQNYTPNTQSQLRNQTQNSMISNQINYVPAFHQNSNNRQFKQQILTHEDSNPEPFNNFYVKIVGSNQFLKIMNKGLTSTKNKNEASIFQLFQSKQIKQFKMFFEGKPVGVNTINQDSYILVLSNELNIPEATWIESLDSYLKINQRRVGFHNDFLACLENIRPLQFEFIASIL